MLSLFHVIFPLVIFKPVFNNRVSTENSVNMSGSVLLNVSGSLLLLRRPQCFARWRWLQAGPRRGDTRRGGTRRHNISAPKLEAEPRPRPWQEHASMMNWSKLAMSCGNGSWLIWSCLILFVTHRQRSTILLRVPVMDPSSLKLPVRSVAWNISTGFVIVQSQAFR